MPEIPDLTVYVEQLERRIRGVPLERVQVSGINLLRTAEPALESLEGREALGVSRLGKRIVMAFEGGLHAALHLMIAGRLHWKEPDQPVARRPLAAFRFTNGTLTLTEAGTRQRASLHVLAGRDALRALDAGGLEPLTSTAATFAAALRRENHTIKRALTDPRLLAGVGNSYSDEILHRAQLSPMRLTSALDDATLERLWHATREVLTEWIDRLRAETGEKFPEKVTAFRKEMAVHGKFGQPCPRCGAKVQRIVHAENETNYCARCQTGGKLLADRALSRLLKKDWPKTLEELEG